MGHTSKEQKVLGPGTQSCVLCAPVSGATPWGGVSPGILWKDDVESHGFREHSPLGFAPGRAALLTTALATVLVTQHLPRMQVLWFSGQHPAPSNQYEECHVLACTELRAASGQPRPALISEWRLP